MRTTHELHQEIRTSAAPEVLMSTDYQVPELRYWLSSLLKERGMAVKDAIRACNLERTYGYQLFNGTRRPTRAVLLRLSLVLELREEEVQRLLKLAGRPVLYARNRADAAVLYGLNHHMTLEETDELLTSLGEEPLL